MTDPLFLGDVGQAGVGDLVSLRGDEGRHAAVVKRIAVGESVLVSDGAGRAVRANVTEVSKQGLDARVAEVLEPSPSPVRFRAVQALAKGERSELAVELLTEVGIHEITAWQSHRSIVRWDGERGVKGLAKWASTAREATKQSRRMVVPVVTDRVLTTNQLVRDLADRRAADPTAMVLVLHEDATTALEEIDPPAHGDVTVIVGPEGGISPDELEALAEQGGIPVVISDGVLRASTAAAVAIVQLKVLLALKADDQ